MKHASALLLLLLATSVPRTHGGAANEGGGDADAVEPEFRWAQRKDRILLTIDLQGVTGESFEVSNEGLFRFSGRGAYRDARDEVRDFRMEIALLKAINASDPSCDGSCEKWKLHPRSTTCKLAEGAEARPWERCTLGSETYNVTHCEVTARDVQCILIKDKRAPYWPHLLKGNARPRNMHVDWSKWLDEDKDGVRWNEQVDRAEDDEEDDSEEAEAAREAERKKQKERFRRGKKKAKKKE
ncbi:hypothetical protein T484DRAFT_1932681 [Baffinella frigidus]|nr:hypothetical protein T484DRAFT_1932681 [Cryptophyta sp. CCMP2293]